MQRIRLAASAATSCLLAACGGDNSSTGPDTPPPPAPVATVVIDHATADVTVGHTRTLKATPRDSLDRPLTGRALTWSTSAGTIATVDANGVVTGVAAGSATITAAVRGKTATAAITVKPASVGSIVIGPESPVVKLGETIALTASVRDDDGSVLTGRQVRWSSSAPAVASVDSLTGLVTGYGRLGDGNAGDSPAPRAVSGGLAFASLSSGNGFACGVATSAALWCWGRNDNGQLGVSSPRSLRARCARAGADRCWPPR